MSSQHVIGVLPEVYILTNNLKMVTASFKIVCFEGFTFLFLKLIWHFYFNNLQSPHIDSPQ